MEPSNVALAIVCLVIAGILAVTALRRERRRLSSAYGDDGYMATRRSAFTGRRATDLCPDPDCHKAARAHLRGDCGNLSVRVGEWRPTPVPTPVIASAGGRANTSGFAARLQDGQPFTPPSGFAEYMRRSMTQDPADVAADDFATPAEAVAVGLPAVPRQRPVRKTAKKNA